jgi:putative methionine-R-sulfoxide reductase with GAF domain
MVSSYLDLAQLSIDPRLIDTALAELDLFLNDESNSVQAVWSYRIPELGEGGACSLFGHLQDEPFELSSILDKSENTQVCLTKLQAIVDFVSRRTLVDWFGIYQTRVTPEGPQLLKLAYVGAPSRPLFPVNEQFAATSNNVQTVMSHHARVINDVQAYVEAGGEYYTCDPKVQAETCLPLFDSANNCIGIIDAEAFSKEFFTPDVLALLIAVCIKIPQYLPE